MGPFFVVLYWQTHQDWDLAVNFYESNEDIGVER